MRKYNLDFEDAIHVATVIDNEISTIFSNDKGFDKVNVVKRVF